MRQRRFGLKNKHSFSIIAAGAMSLLSPLSAQEPAHAAPEQTLGPPVYVEGTFGNNRFDLQTFISKRFEPTSKGGLLSITSAQGSYSNNSNSFEFVNVTQLNYEVFQGLSPTLGVALNRQVGVELTAGLQYQFVRSNLLVVLAPSVFLSGSRDIQNVLAVLYQPKIGSHWKVYGNVQVLDDYVMSSDLNVRSFAHTRMGLTHGRCTFGIGNDLDWYGLPSGFRANIGPYIGYSF